MPNYKWQGQHDNGENAHGIIDAENILLAKTLLRKQNIIPQGIRRVYNWQIASPIKTADIAFVARQLATLLAAGIPLLQTLELIAKGQTKRTLQNVLQHIIASIESGLSLAAALRHHPRYFNGLFCHLVTVGEQTGNLDHLLGRIATHQEKLLTLKRKITKALHYPVAVVGIAIMATATLLVFVVPQFAALFQAVGSVLPWPTRCVIALSQATKQYGGWLLAVVTSGIYAYRLAMRRFNRCIMLVDHCYLHLPIIGKIVYHAAIARIMRTLAITITAGIPLMDALPIVLEASGNRVITQRMATIRDSVASGQALHIALQNTALFPAMAVHMIALGEASGTLDTMLARLADFFETQVDNATDGLSTLIEPVIMVILGLLIGGLVVAMYMPIFKLGALF